MMALLTSGQWSVVGDNCQFWTNDHLMVGKSEQCED